MVELRWGGSEMEPWRVKQMVLAIQTIIYLLDLQNYWENQSKIKLHLYHVTVNIYIANLKSRSGAETWAEQSDSRAIFTLHGS